MAATAKAKQTNLPGLDMAVDPQIEAAAESYREFRDERCALNKKESEAKQTLIHLMQSKGLQFYKYHGLTVVLTAEPSVKVKAKEDEDDDSITPRKARAQKAKLASETAEITVEPDSVEIVEDAPEMTSVGNVLNFFGRTEAGTDNCINCEHSLANHNDDEACDIEACHCDQYAGIRPVEEGEAAPVEADDFTAEMCAECRAIDGAHSADCSKGSGLVEQDYLDYAKHNNIKSGASWARKWQLTHEKDALIQVWKAEGAKGRAERAKVEGPEVEIRREKAKARRQPARTAH